LLHIGYKQDVKTFRAKKEEKKIVEPQTVDVKEAFKRELGLVVDQRREGGFGTTNTGNVVRKAFGNAEKTIFSQHSQMLLDQRREGGFPHLNLFLMLKLHDYFNV